VKQDVTSTTQGTASADRAKLQYNVFAGADVLTTNPGMYGEGLRQQIVMMLAFQSDSYYAQHRPYAWSFLAANDRVVAFNDELICKQLAGKPPAFNERKDSTFDYNAPRKFGLLLYEDNSRDDMEAQIDKELAQCGVH